MDVLPLSENSGTTYLTIVNVDYRNAESETYVLPMALATVTSRVLGMVREMVYSAFMGTHWEASAFFLATYPAAKRALVDGAVG